MIQELLRWVAAGLLIIGLPTLGYYLKVERPLRRKCREVEKLQAAGIILRLTWTTGEIANDFAETLVIEGRGWLYEVCMTEPSHTRGQIPREVRLLFANTAGETWHSERVLQVFEMLRGRRGGIKFSRIDSDPEMRLRAGTPTYPRSEREESPPSERVPLTAT